MDLAVIDNGEITSKKSASKLPDSPAKVSAHAQLIQSKYEYSSTQNVPISPRIQEFKLEKISCDLDQTSSKSKKQMIFSKKRPSQLEVDDDDNLTRINTKDVDKNRLFVPILPIGYGPKTATNQQHSSNDYKLIHHAEEKILTNSAISSLNIPKNTDRSGFTH